MRNDNRRIAVNTGILYVRMLLIMAITIYTSRILLKALGITDYGIYNVVGSAVTLFSFLNSCLIPVTQRYLSIELGKRNYKRLNTVFNVSISIHVFIALVIVVLCETCGVWLLNCKMVIPADRLVAANWCFQLSLLGLVLSIISIPYNGLIISHEKMNAFAYISLVDVLLKLVICYVVDNFHSDRLILYGVLIVVAQTLSQFLYWAYCNKKFQESKLCFVGYSALHKEILRIAGWGLFAHIPYAINTSLINMLLNMFFSPIVNAARGISVQVTSALQQFGTNLQTSVTPQITKSYAMNDYERMLFLIINSSRFSIYLLFIIVLPVYMRLEDILSLWLVEVPEYTSSFIRITIIGSFLTCLQTPLTVGLRSQGNIGKPFFWSGIAELFVVPICYLFLLFEYSPTTVFIVQVVVELLVLVIRVYYCNILIGLSISKNVCKARIYPITQVIVISGVSFLTLSNISVSDTGFWYLLTVSLFCIILSLIMICMLGLRKSERKKISEFVIKRLHIY